ncbi:uncharacterized protein LOC112568961 [Pomacea canaliculata]|uniref:uncharacterized protein LOC112568961 n=1 Tax=Pomacea canaliculata TaxID=400727 RepID=UPI000D73EB35|nr:uncharacterized protein LOC112568961 [Pomacea canaliculata]
MYKHLLIIYFKIADVTNQRSTPQNQSSGDTAEHYLTPVTTNKLSTTQGRATPLYDALQMKDVGMQSLYEGIRQEHKGSEISSNKDLSGNMRRTRNEPIYVN